MCHKNKVWTCLCCNHKLVSNASFLGPLAYEFLRAFILTDIKCQLRMQHPTIHDILIVCRVYKVSLLVVSDCQL